MMKEKILVLGKTGQLAGYLQQISVLYQEFSFTFWGRAEFDFTNPIDKKKIKTLNPKFIINAVAYTKVDLAETEKIEADLINHLQVGELAIVANEINAVFIHISTDYVFSGNKRQPYHEQDSTEPLNQYGISKRRGELLIQQYCQQYIIIRTSWVYASFGKNFVLTMIKLMTEKNELKIVNDQYGCPTWAKDLAFCLLTIIRQSKDINQISGVYHYQNIGGPITWYDFTNFIKSFFSFKTILFPVSSKEFPTPAKRPLYSVLSVEKISTIFNQVKISSWQDSLNSCLNEYRKSPY